MHHVGMFRVSLSYYSLTFLWRLAACLKWYGVDKVQMKQQLLKCGLWRDSSDDIVHKDSLLLCACKKKRHPYPPCTDNETVAQDESVRGQWDFAQLSDCISGVTVVQLLHAPYSWSPLPSAGIKRDVPAAQDESVRGQWDFGTVASCMRLLH